ncbi:scarecrow-like protein 14 isoform X1 [Fagus crenata]
MDHQGLSELYGPNNGLKFSDEIDTGTKSVDQNCASFALWQPDPIHSDLTPTLSVKSGVELHEDEDYDFSDMLMEEDMEEKTSMHQGSAELKAAEKSFYELLGEKYPHSPDIGLMPYLEKDHEISDEYHALNHSDCSCGTSCNNFVIHGWNCDLVRSESSNIGPQSTSSESSYSLLEGTGNVIDGFVDYPQSVPEAIYDGSKFLANGDSLLVPRESNGFIYKEQKEETKNVVCNLEKRNEKLYSLDRLRAKKNPHLEDMNLEEGRSIKQSAACAESTVNPEMFDMILLNSEEGDSVLFEAVQNEEIKNAQPGGQSKGSIGGKANRRKTRGKRGVVDLRTLLTLCAEFVAANDQTRATELLKQIRQHASPVGDGKQRMAHYFANGLQARIAGSGTQIYKANMTRRTSAADVLKAHHLFITAFPFFKLADFVSRKTIMNLVENEKRLHIVDFGILYGFIWPSLIQQLSARPGGPPKLRITGIDFPEPGFRPAQRVEQTGCRLANYAETFNVPFEFNAIAQKWDTIQIEDLKLDNNEVLVVNNMYTLKHLPDETVVVENPRDIVLNLIRKMNPHVFIQGIVNAAHGVPFFTSRFRQALFHFPTMFEMFETCLSCESSERMFLESEVYGWQAMNVIACEGLERIVRPETYKQWQLRNLRTGFRQLPLNQEMKNTAKDWVKSHYHKDFVIDEDSQWLLQGWKGRTFFCTLFLEA